MRSIGPSSIETVGRSRSARLSRLFGFLILACALLGAAGCAAREVAKLPGPLEVRPTTAEGRRCYEICGANEGDCFSMCPTNSPPCREECSIDRKLCMFRCPDLERLPLPGAEVPAEK